MTTKLVIGITPSVNSLTKNIKVFSRSAGVLGNVVASGATDEYGGIMFDVPAGNYLVLKEATDSTENSQVLDYVVPQEYTVLSLKAKMFDSSWITLRPQTIQMSYSNPINISSQLGEFNINGGAWVSSGTIVDTDIIECRLPTPVGGLLSEPAHFRLKVGPYTYQYKSYENLPGKVMELQSLTLFRVQKYSTVNYTIMLDLPLFRVQKAILGPLVWPFSITTTFIKVQVIRVF